MGSWQTIYLCEISAQRKGDESKRPASKTACGASGGACVPCGNQQECSPQGQCVCDAASCPSGCCDKNGQGQTSGTTTCGTGGAACVACASGQACGATGSCVCNASSCNGSCSATSTGPCTWSGGPSSSSGEITCYWFGQGTEAGGGCTGNKTYCGYCGAETGSNNGGTCPTGITDTVPNTGTPYFAAFPVGRFGQGIYCGMCVDVTWMGKTVTATIVGECATCPTSSHLDLSLSAAAALGLGRGRPRATPRAA